VIHITKKLQPIIQSLKYANKLLPRHILRAQYYTHVYPHLIGAISVWGTADPKKQYMRPLVLTQKKIIRLICNLPPCTHTKPLMKDLKILDMNNLYRLRVCIEMHPFIHHTKQLNRPTHDHKYIFTAQIHDYPTRYAQQHHAYIPNQNQKGKGKMTMAFLTTEYSHTWNKIPQRIRDILAISIFKKELRKHLLQEQNSS
jgi:hypothetical protein